MDDIETHIETYTSPLGTYRPALIAALQDASSHLDAAWEHIGHIIGFASADATRQGVLIDIDTLNGFVNDISVNGGTVGQLWADTIERTMLNTEDAE